MQKTSVDTSLIVQPIANKLRANFRGISDAVSELVQIRGEAIYYYANLVTSKLVKQLRAICFMNMADIVKAAGIGTRRMTVGDEYVMYSEGCADVVKLLDLMVEQSVEELYEEEVTKLKDILPSDYKTKLIFNMKTAFNITQVCKNAFLLLRSHVDALHSTMVQMAGSRKDFVNQIHRSSPSGMGRSAVNRIITIGGAGFENDAVLDFPVSTLKSLLPRELLDDNIPAFEKLITASQFYVISEVCSVDNPNFKLDHERAVSKAYDRWASSLHANVDLHLRDFQQQLEHIVEDDIELYNFTNQPTKDFKNFVTSFFEDYRANISGSEGIRDITTKVIVFLFEMNEALRHMRANTFLTPMVEKDAKELVSLLSSGLSGVGVENIYSKFVAGSISDMDSLIDNITVYLGSNREFLAPFQLWSEKHLKDKTVVEKIYTSYLADGRIVFNTGPIVDLYAKVFAYNFARTLLDMCVNQSVERTYVRPLSYEVGAPDHALTAAAVNAAPADRKMAAFNKKILTEENARIIEGLILSFGNFKRFDAALPGTNFNGTDKRDLTQEAFVNYEHLKAGMLNFVHALPSSRHQFTWDLTRAKRDHPEITAGAPFPAHLIEPTTRTRIDRRSGKSFTLRYIDVTANPANNTTVFYPEVDDYKTAYSTVAAPFTLTTNPAAPVVFAQSHTEYLERFIEEYGMRITGADAIDRIPAHAFHYADRTVPNTQTFTIFECLFQTKYIRRMDADPVFQLMEEVPLALFSLARSTVILDTNKLLEKATVDDHLGRMMRRIAGGVESHGVVIDLFPSVALVLFMLSYADLIKSTEQVEPVTTTNPNPPGPVVVKEKKPFFTRATAVGPEEILYRLCEQLTETPGRIKLLGAQDMDSVIRAVNEILRITGTNLVDIANHVSSFALGDLKIRNVSEKGISVSRFEAMYQSFRTNVFDKILQAPAGSTTWNPTLGDAVLMLKNKCDEVKSLPGYNPNSSFANLIAWAMEFSFDAAADDVNANFVKSADAVVSEFCDEINLVQTEKFANHLPSQFIGAMQNQDSVCSAVAKVYMHAIQNNGNLRYSSKLPQWRVTAIGEIMRQLNLFQVESNKTDIDAFDEFLTKYAKIGSTFGDPVTGPEAFNTFATNLASEGTVLIPANSQVRERYSQCMNYFRRNIAIDRFFHDIPNDGNIMGTVAGNASLSYVRAMTSNSTYGVLDADLNLLTRAAPGGYINIPAGNPATPLRERIHFQVRRDIYNANNIPGQIVDLINENRTVEMISRQIIAEHLISKYAAYRHVFTKTVMDLIKNYVVAKHADTILSSVNSVKTLESARAKLVPCMLGPLQNVFSNFEDLYNVFEFFAIPKAPEVARWEWYTMCRKYFLALDVIPAGGEAARLIADHPQHPIHHTPGLDQVHPFANSREIELFFAKGLFLPGITEFVIPPLTCGFGAPNQLDLLVQSIIRQAYHDGCSPSQMFNAVFSQHFNAQKINNAMTPGAFAEYARNAVWAALDEIHTISNMHLASVLRLYDAEATAFNSNPLVHFHCSHKGLIREQIIRAIQPFIDIFVDVYGHLSLARLDGLAGHQVNQNHGVGYRGLWPMLGRHNSNTIVNVLTAAAGAADGFVATFNTAMAAVHEPSVAFPPGYNAPMAAQASLAPAQPTHVFLVNFMTKMNISAIGPWVRDLLLRRVSDRHTIAANPPVANKVVRQRVNNTQDQTPETLSNLHDPNILSTALPDVIIAPLNDQELFLSSNDDDLSVTHLCWQQPAAAPAVTLANAPPAQLLRNYPFFVNFTEAVTLDRTFYRTMRDGFKNFDLTNLPLPYDISPGLFLDLTPNSFEELMSSVSSLSSYMIERGAQVEVFKAFLLGVYVKDDFGHLPISIYQSKSPSCLRYVDRYCDTSDYVEAKRAVARLTILSNMMRYCITPLEVLMSTCTKNTIELVYEWIRYPFALKDATEAHYDAVTKLADPFALSHFKVPNFRVNPYGAPAAAPYRKAFICDSGSNQALQLLSGCENVAMPPASLLFMKQFTENNNEREVRLIRDLHFRSDRSAFITLLGMCMNLDPGLTEFSTGVDYLAGIKYSLAGIFENVTSMSTQMTMSALQSGIKSFDNKTFDLKIENLRTQLSVHKPANVINELQMWDTFTADHLYISSQFQQSGKDALPMRSTIQLIDQMITGTASPFSIFQSYQTYTPYQLVSIVMTAFITANKLSDKLPQPFAEVLRAQFLESFDYGSRDYAYHTKTASNADIVKLDQTARGAICYGLQDSAQTPERSLTEIEPVAFTQLLGGHHFIDETIQPNREIRFGLDAVALLNLKRACEASTVPLNDRPGVAGPGHSADMNRLLSNCAIFRTFFMKLLNMLNFLRTLEPQQNLEHERVAKLVTGMIAVCDGFYARIKDSVGTRTVGGSHALSQLNSSDGSPVRGAKFTFKNYQDFCKRAYIENIGSSDFWGLVPIELIFDNKSLTMAVVENVFPAIGEMVKSSKASINVNWIASVWLLNYVLATMRWFSISPSGHPEYMDNLIKVHHSGKHFDDPADTDKHWTTKIPKIPSNLPDLQKAFESEFSTPANAAEYLAGEFYGNPGYLALRLKSNVEDFRLPRPQPQIDFNDDTGANAYPVGSADWRQSRINTEFSHTHFGNPAVGLAAGAVPGWVATAGRRPTPQTRFVAADLAHNRQLSLFAFSQCFELQRSAPDSLVLNWARHAWPMDGILFNAPPDLVPHPGVVARMTAMDGAHVGSEAPTRALAPLAAVFNAEIAHIGNVNPSRRHRFIGGPLFEYSYESSRHTLISFIETKCVIADLRFAQTLSAERKKERFYFACHKLGDLRQAKNPLSAFDISNSSLVECYRNRYSSSEIPDAVITARLNAAEPAIAAAFAGGGTLNGFAAAGSQEYIRNVIKYTITNLTKFIESAHLLVLGPDAATTDVSSLVRAHPEEYHTVLNYNFAALNGDARPLATPAALRIPIDTCFTIDADPHPAVPTIVIRVLKYIDAVTRSKTNERTWKKSEPSLPKEIFTRKDQDLLVMIPIDEKNRKGMEAGFKLMRSLGIKILDTRKFGAESAFYDIFLAIDRDLFLKNFSRLPRDPMSTAAGATADSAFPCFVAPIVDMIHGLTINPL